MNAKDTFLAANAHVDAAAVQPLPNSRKVYIEGSRPDIQVPMLRGLTRDQAANRLQAMGLLVGYVRFADQPGARPGVVLEQRPSPGVRLPRRSRVDLTLARTP